MDNQEIKYTPLEYRSFRIENPMYAQHEADMKALLDYIESDNIPRWVTPATIRLWLGKEDEIKMPKKRWWQFWRPKQLNTPPPISKIL